MHYPLNKYDEGKNFIRYTGKVLTVETHRGSSVSGTTTNTISAGKVLNIQSRGFKSTTVKVMLPTGRHKEFDGQGIEMQEGDEVDFVITDMGCPIYAKNITTGIEEVAQPVYYSEGVIAFFLIVLILCIVVGCVLIFQMGLVFKGVVCAGAAGAVLIFYTQKLEKGVHASVLQFQDKLLATGVAVKNFKPVRRS